MEFSLYNAEIFLYKPLTSKVFSQFEIIKLAFCDLFEYLCYGPTAIRNSFNLTVHVSISDVITEHI